jgi:hypothetical protein
MSVQLPSIDSTGVIRRFAAGEVDALAEYLVHHKQWLLRVANRLIHKRTIDEAALDGEGALDMALRRLSHAGGGGVLGSIPDGNAFMRLMITLIESLINDQRKRSAAAKRAGPGSARAIRANAGQSDASGAATLLPSVSAHSPIDGRPSREDRSRSSPHFEAAPASPLFAVVH